MHSDFKLYDVVTVVPFDARSEAYQYNQDLLYKTGPGSDPDRCLRTQQERNAFRPLLTMGSKIKHVYMYADQSGSMTRMLYGNRKFNAPDELKKQDFSSGYDLVHERVPSLSQLYIRAHEMSKEYDGKPVILLVSEEENVAFHFFEQNLHLLPKNVFLSRLAAKDTLSIHDINVLRERWGCIQGEGNRDKEPRKTCGTTMTDNNALLDATTRRRARGNYEVVCSLTRSQIEQAVGAIQQRKQLQRRQELNSVAAIDENVSQLHAREARQRQEEQAAAAAAAVIQRAVRRRQSRAEATSAIPPPATSRASSVSSASVVSDSVPQAESSNLFTLIDDMAILAKKFENEGQKDTHRHIERNLRILKAEVTDTLSDKFVSDGQRQQSVERCTGALGEIKTLTAGYSGWGAAIRSFFSGLFGGWCKSKPGTPRNCYNAALSIQGCVSTFARETTPGPNV